MKVLPSALRFGGRPLLALLSSCRNHSAVPVFIHLDHAEREEDIVLAIEGGVDSVMVDGSSMCFEDNIEFTRKMVRLQ